jgi:hypothetical protein
MRYRVLLKTKGAKGVPKCRLAPTSESVNAPGFGRRKGISFLLKHKTTTCFMASPGTMGIETDRTRGWLID